MAKNPVFPLYYNDIDRSTKTWTDEEFGAYVRLLLEQWDKGSIPNDYQRLTRIATSLDRNWAMLKIKFPEVDGVLKNARLEEIREQKAKHSQKQKENVRNRYQKPTKPHTKNLPLEIENEIESENEIVNEWVSWGQMIVEEKDPHWVNRRKVSQDEMDNFLSVAVRCKWEFNTQQEFRISLNGFDAKKYENIRTNKATVGGARPIIFGDKQYNGKL